MPQPVTVKVASRASTSISGQSVILIIFVGILAYVLFAGGNKNDSTDTGGGGGGHIGAGQIPASAPASAATIQPGSAWPASGALTGSQPASGEQATAEKIDFGPDPQRWVDEEDVPSSLRAIDQTPRPGALKKEGQPRRRKSVDWRDEQRPGTPLQETHPDNMMSGGGTTPTHYEMGTRPRLLPPNPAVEPEIDRRLRESSAQLMFGDMNLPRDDFQRLNQLEYIAMIHHKRDGPKGPIPWKANGKPANRRHLEEIARWDDPDKEEWDEVWGCLPTIGVEAATLIARYIREEDINTLGGMMATREASGGKKNKDRSFSAFVARTAPDAKGKLTPIRLCIGWFADTYRCVHFYERMKIDHSVVDMRQGLALVSNGLQWLEAMATHMWRRRIFTSTGVDLHGLVVRMAVPPRLLPKRKREDADTFEYELETNIFMWGGPVPEGKDLIRHWARRVSTAARSMETCRIELANTLHALGYTEHIVTLCKRRRLIFRPGFTVHGVNVSQALSDGVDRNQAHQMIIRRDPQIVVFPDQRWSHLPVDVDSKMRTIILMSYPQTASICNSRQHQWNSTSLTDENNRFNDIQLLMILRSIGPALDREKNGGTVRTGHTIEQLDFGSFVPLVKVEGQQPGSDVRFYPLDDFQAVSQIVLPYVSQAERERQGQTHGETAGILLDPSYGIQSRLEGPVEMDKLSTLAGEPVRITLPQLQVQITCSSSGRVAELKRQILEQIWSLARRWIQEKLVTTGGQNAQGIKTEARREFGSWLGRFVKRSVYAVNADKTDEAEKMGAKNIVGRELDFTEDELRWPSDLQ